MKTYKITKYLNFTILKDSGKTLTIGVGNNSADKLGYIKWIAGWRRYGFFPIEGTQFDLGCLQEICEEIKELMEKRKTDAN